MPAAGKTQRVREELDRILASAESADELMGSICKFLRENMRHYNWVGFYMLEKSPGPVLVLGPFQGIMTPHTRIGLDQGICGAAASSGHTIIVNDVNQDPRYLACSLQTKSEIVVPVFSHGEVVGELDIDSHFPAAFTEDDRQLVEHCASLVGHYLENSSSQ